MNEPTAVPHAAVIGWPVEHSLSPVIHGYWLRHYGIAGSYEKLLVSPDELSTVLSGLQNRGLVGANVTIPHKVAALQAVDRVTAVAERIGAVNTLYFDNRALVGDNSDAEGFAENLRANAATWLPASGPAVVSWFWRGRSGCRRRSLGRWGAGTQAAQSDKVPRRGPSQGFRGTLSGR